MNVSSLKKAVESIEMTDAMRQRIAANSKKILTEDRNMKKTGNWFRRPVAVTALLALCICLPIAGVAAGNSGYFRNVMRGTAVVGTEYTQVTVEIGVTAQYKDDCIAVQAVFLVPDKAPFTELEALAVGPCRILDAAGKTVAEFDGSGASAITGGQAVMILPGKDLEPGSYTLRIDAFVGSKKADQDLTLMGCWECALTVE